MRGNRRIQTACWRGPSSAHVSCPSLPCIHRTRDSVVHLVALLQGCNEPKHAVSKNWQQKVLVAFAGGIICSKYFFLEVSVGLFSDLVSVLLLKGGSGHAPPPLLSATQQPLHRMRCPYHLTQLIPAGPGHWHLPIGDTNTDGLQLSLL